MPLIALGKVLNKEINSNPETYQRSMMNTVWDCPAR